MADNSRESLAYMTHLRAEHRRLQDCLRRIERQWIEEPVGPAEVIPQRVIDDLRTLRAELAHHFEEEESGGCLEEAVARQPRLSHDANRLEHEHAALLEQIDRLLAKVTATACLAQSAEEVKTDFRRFAEQLQAHEEAENRILEQGFCVEPD